MSILDIRSYQDSDNQTIKDSIDSINTFSHIMMVLSGFSVSYKGRKSSVKKINWHDENGNIYQENQLIHVLLHEIAHAVCDEIGHTEKFNQILDIFLIEAEKNGLYNPKIPPIVNYCQYSDE